MVYKAGVSDKNLHLAYFVLVFLLWFAISHDKKVNWRKTVAWWVLFGVTGYGIIGEALQDYVGHTPDFVDFLADFGGVLYKLKNVPISLAAIAIVVIVAALAALYFPVERAIRRLYGNV